VYNPPVGLQGNSSHALPAQNLPSVRLLCPEEKLAAREARERLLNAYRVSHAKRSTHPATRRTGPALAEAGGEGMQKRRGSHAEGAGRERWYCDTMSPCGSCQIASGRAFKGTPGMGRLPSTRDACAGTAVTGMSGLSGTATGQAAGAFGVHAVGASAMALASKRDFPPSWVIFLRDPTSHSSGRGWCQEPRVTAAP